MKKVLLTNSMVALVDDRDYERVIAHRWSLDADGYAVTSIEKRRVFMRRFILNQLPGFVTDHINGNTLDNRRRNLRACTQGENSRHRIRLNRNNRAGFRGVSLSGPGRWMARIEHNKKRHHLGVFASPEEAARAFDVKARELRGRAAVLNFPEAA